MGPVVLFKRRSNMTFAFVVVAAAVAAFVGLLLS
jgi:hypothetical protein